MLSTFLLLVRPARVLAQKLDDLIPPMVLGLILGSTLEKISAWPWSKSRAACSVFLDTDWSCFWRHALSLVYSAAVTLKASAREAERLPRRARAPEVRAESDTCQAARTKRLPVRQAFFWLSAGVRGAWPVAGRLAIERRAMAAPEARSRFGRGSNSCGTGRPARGSPGVEAHEVIAVAGFATAFE